jgi:thiamine-monophosphate kinase
MGARPVAAFVSLAVPQELAGEWTRRFYDGLLNLAKAEKATLAGGDLSESPIPLVDIVLVGAVPTGEALLRSTAKPGHAIYVTGTLGGSSVGLAQLAQLAESDGEIPKPQTANGKVTAAALHLYPQPRIAQGLWLRKRGVAAAAIDISDGLSTDIMHLCEESGVAAEIDADLLPIFRGATLDQALHGGEDYELLFTSAASTHIPRSIAGVPITRIGRILRQAKNRPAITLKTAQGSNPLQPRGWQHFA